MPSIKVQLLQFKNVIIRFMLVNYWGERQTNAFKVNNSAFPIDT